jgi:hypothetical protein
VGALRAINGWLVVLAGLALLAAESTGGLIAGFVGVILMDAQLG